ncbi:MAG: 16S rRNA (guanine(966)-N(2))-methyltransferase RsmD [Tissierellia bacterium]|nr:16S rRNA (guanine(966)-N(2))-methyltransferase RsmD [Tissierellia bacterium]
MRIISGKDRGRRLFSPKGDDVRPTEDRVKESVFNIISPIIKDSIVLDLFSGSGSIGCEFISRGARIVYFNELRYSNINTIKKNIEMLGYEYKSAVIKSDFRKTLLKLKEEQIHFDIIFIDPPYGKGLELKALDLIREYEIINEDGLLILETAELADDFVGYNIIDKRKYGNTFIILLKLEVFDDSDLSG